MYPFVGGANCEWLQPTNPAYYTFKDRVMNTSGAEQTFKKIWMEKSEFNDCIFHSIMNKALVVLEVQQKPLVIKATTARWNFEGQPGEVARSFIRLHVWRNSAGIHISSSLISCLVTRPQSNISLVGKTVVQFLPLTFNTANEINTSAPRSAKPARNVCITKTWILTQCVCVWVCVSALIILQGAEIRWHFCRHVKPCQCLTALSVWITVAACAMCQQGKLSESV